MKKKKGLSEEALKTLMSSTEAETEQEHEVDPAAQAADSQDADIDANIDTDVDTDVDAMESEEVTALKTELSDAKEVITDLEAKAEAAEAKTVSVVAASESLKGIVISQISKMRMALKIAAVDMTKWDIEAVVNEYDSTSEAFMSALPVGSVIPKEEETEAVAAIASSLDASKVSSLGF